MPAVLTAAEALKCPAGDALEDTGKGPGVRCRIAHTTLTREGDSSSLTAFCAGCYEDCPIFRRNRRAFYEDSHRALGRELIADTPRSER